MRSIALLAVIALVGCAAPAAAQDVVEPKSGVGFAPKTGGMSLLGVALRTKTFLHVKVYAAGFYVADSALAGPLAVHRGNTGTPAFYHDLVNGDFEKQMTLKLVRDLSPSQIQGAFRETLVGADSHRVEEFTGIFSSDLKAGDQIVLHWTKGILETSAGGLSRVPIADAEFASRVFAIWLGEHPVQEDVKRDLVARADSLLK
jgi:hypothetical protein